jgi:hypothetical protein
MSGIRANYASLLPSAIACFYFPVVQATSACTMVPLRSDAAR